MDLAITIIGACLASSGLWSLVLYMITRKDKQKEKASDIDTAMAQMVKGLGHDRITYLGMQYITRGYVTQDEYENLYEYLYKPYKALGGNGSATRIMDQVTALPLKKG